MAARPLLRAFARVCGATAFVNILHVVEGATRFVGATLLSRFDPIENFTYPI